MVALHLPLCRPVSLSLVRACSFLERLPPKSHWGTWARHCRETVVARSPAKGAAMRIATCLAFAILCLECLLAGEIKASPFPALQDSGYNGQAIGVGGPLVGGVTCGWEFTPQIDILVTELGFYDFLGDGLSIRHDVGIWDEQGLLLTWARVPAGRAAPLVGEYRYAPAPQVLLLTGHSYIVGATAPVSLSNPTGWLEDMYPNSTIEIDITKIAADPRLYLVVADRYYSDIRGGYSDPLVFPDYHAPAGDYFDLNTGEFVRTIYPYLFAANFQFVPEPGTLMLLTAGLLILMRQNNVCLKVRRFLNDRA